MKLINYIYKYFSLILINVIFLLKFLSYIESFGLNLFCIVFNYEIKIIFIFFTINSLYK